MVSNHSGRVSAERDGIHHNAGLRILVGELQAQIADLEGRLGEDVEELVEARRRQTRTVSGPRNPTGPPSEPPPFCSGDEVHRLSPWHRRTVSNRVRGLDAQQ